MSTATVEELKTQALRLSPNARAYLAEVLIESLDEEDDFPLSETGLAEVQRRVADIDSGVAKSIPGDEAIRRLMGGR